MFEKVPRSILILFSLGCFALSGFWLKGANADITKAINDNIDQEARIKILEKNFDKIDIKLDRIGERLGVKS